MTIFILTFLYRFNIYQDLSEVGFWLFVAFSLTLITTGIYQFFKTRSSGNTGTSGSSEDETERDEEYLQQFIRATPVPVAMFNGRMEFMAASDRLLQDFELKAEEMRGRSFDEVFGEVSEEWRETCQTCLTGVSERLEEPFTRENGKTEWFRCDIQPWFREQERVGGLVIFFELMTGRKETEANLQKAKELAEEASRSKSNFIAHMSHELRTPLTSILGYTQMLEIDPELKPTQLGQIQEIKKSGEHLLAIINDILQVSKIETGKISFEGEDIDLQKLLNKIIDSESEKFSEAHNQVSVEFDKELPAVIHTDLEKLQVIITNLVTNAFKFTEGGKIDISVELEPVKGNGADGLLIVRVADTGEGIPPDKIQYVFKPFTQVHQQYNKGTGLGLSLSRRLAQFLGGTLTAKSKTGEGSVFTLEIPVQFTAEDLQVAEPPVSREIAGKQVNQQLSAKEVGEWIRHLDPRSIELIHKALELQDLETLSEIDVKLDLSGHQKSEAVTRLIESAENFDYLFITNLSKELAEENG